MLTVFPYSAGVIRKLTTDSLKLWLLRTIAPGCLLLLLAGCATGPGSSGREGQTPEDGISAEELTLVEAMLEEAGTLPSPESEALYYETAQLLYDLDEFEQADGILRPLETDPLPLQLSAEIISLRAEIRLQLGEPEAALTLLNDERLNALPRLSDRLQTRIRELRATSHAATGQYLLSAQERIFLDSRLRADRREENHERIWAALGMLDVQQLMQLSETSVSYEFQAWYELALVGKRYRYNLDLQQVELEQWLYHWSRHPAAAYLPRQLRLIASLSENRPKQIALLLPLQTQAGRVVRNGFMSAYFNARDIGIGVPEVRFYDSTGHDDILALHQQARDEGAELIIGPLLKQQVVTLQNVRDLGVPTLALNTIDARRPRSDLLYQFSLTPENEARQIARKAWEEGHRRVAIMGPAEGNENDYFSRKRRAFIDEWQSVGGAVASNADFRDNYTETIEQLLHISNSQYRHEQLSDLLGTTPEFIPRRRQDLDFIFLLSQPGPARQIKPSLAYLYAGDLPVFATQDIYSGTPRPQADADLNGIQFTDSPWLLTDLDELRNETLRLFPQNSALYSRLQAFGVDAFRLYPRLSQFEELDDLSIPGATGQLYMTADRSVHQRYTWARIRNGLAVITDSPDDPLAQGGAYETNDTPAAATARRGL